MLAKVITTESSKAQVLINTDKILSDFQNTTQCETLNDVKSQVHCGACGILANQKKHSKPFHAWAYNLIHAQKDDIVEVTLTQRAILHAILFLFLVPTIGILIFAFLFTQNEWATKNSFTFLILATLISILYALIVFLYTKNQVYFEIIKIHTKEG